MRIPAATIATFALVLAASAWAQKEAAPAPAVSPPAKIAAMAWLKGYWVGEGFGGTVEDLWGPPKAGVMLGSFRHMKADGKPGFYEIAALEEVDDTLRLVVKHFHPNWIGWEDKEHALQAKLVRLTADEAVFGNMTFRRVGKDALVIELDIRSKDGTARKEILRYKRRAL